MEQVPVCDASQRGHVTLRLLNDVLDYDADRKPLGTDSVQQNARTRTAIRVCLIRNKIETETRKRQFGSRFILVTNGGRPLRQALTRSFNTSPDQEGAAVNKRDQKPSLRFRRTAFNKGCGESEVGLLAVEEDFVVDGNRSEPKRLSNVPDGRLVFGTYDLEFFTMKNCCCELQVWSHQIFGGQRSTSL